MSCPTDPQPLYSSKPGAGWAGTVPPPQRIVGVRTYTYVITYRARGFHPLSSADGNDFFFPLGIAHMGGRVHGADRVLRRVRPETVWPAAGRAARPVGWPGASGWQLRRSARGKTLLLNALICFLSIPLHRRAAFAVRSAVYGRGR